MIINLINRKIEVQIESIGARINALKVGGTDIGLGFKSQEDYEKSGCYAGATIGRVANRIANGRFTLNGKEYKLNTNDGKNHLHGGNAGFDKKLFTVLEQTENSLTMQYISADGEENYPAELKFTVKYTVENDALLIEYKATADGDTLWCPTNHAYFNLDGEASGDCGDNLLQINADKITLINSGLIPTGEIATVSKTAFDFRKAKPINKDLHNVNLQATLGYDHNYILNGEHAAHAESKLTGIIMDVFTDMPCMQFYSGGQLNKVKGKSGIYNQYAGFCLEPQYCPNAINLQGFDKPILKKGEEKKHYIKLAF